MQLAQFQKYSAHSSFIYAFAQMICMAMIFLSIAMHPFVVMAEDVTTSNLIKQVDYLQTRHEVLAQNVANVSTPKYTTQDLEKPEFLASKNHKVKVPKVKMRITNSHHLAGKHKNSKYSVVLDKESPMKPNKNNVDMAKQVTNIAQNSDESAAALKNYRSAMDLINAASGNQ
jgi:flagellar basal-body rod protein FlgB